MRHSIKKKKSGQFLRNGTWGILLASKGTCTQCAHIQSTHTDRGLSLFSFLFIFPNRVWLYYSSLDLFPICHTSKNNKDLAMSSWLQICSQHPMPQRTFSNGHISTRNLPTCADYAHPCIYLWVLATALTELYSEKPELNFFKIK